MTFKYLEAPGYSWLNRKMRNFPRLVLLVSAVTLLAGSLANSAHAEGLIASRELNPETSQLSTKAGDLPFYANFARSKDGRVIAQIANGEESHQLMMSFSRDFGATWTYKLVATLQASQPGPKITVSDDGATIAAFWADGNWSAPNGVLWTISSSDSGQSWGTPKVIGSGLSLEKISLQWVASNSSGKYLSCAFVTNGVSNSNSAPLSLYVATSNDGGITWNVHKSPAQNTIQLIGDLQLSSDGKTIVYIYDIFGDAKQRGTFYVGVSTDGGVSWGSEVKAFPNPSGSYGVKILEVTSEKIRILDPFSTIFTSVDRGKTFQKGETLSGNFSKFAQSRDGRTMIVLSSEILSQTRSVILARSEDGGATWKKQKLVFQQGLLLDFATSPDLQNMAVVLSDSMSRATFMQVSSDGGNSWSDPINLMEQNKYLLPMFEGSRTALVFDEARKNFFFAFQEYTVVNRLSSTLKGVDVKLLNVNFDGNGSTDDFKAQSVLLPAYAKYELFRMQNFVSAPTRTHFDFQGWGLEKSSGASKESTLVLDRDYTLFAQWIEKPKIQISYQSNGVLTKLPKPELIYTDESITASSKFVARTGYSFKSWNTERDGSGISFKPGDEIPERETSIQLFAMGGKNSQITCMKGKVVKKVVDFQPSCPEGYKRK